MMILVMALSFVACGGDENSKTGDLVEVTGNGLSFKLPADIKHVKTDENYGSMLFTNEERNVVVTLGAMTEEALTSAEITDEFLFTVLSVANKLSDASFESSRTIEHDDGTSVVGFGKGTMSNGREMNSVIQYFFPADGGGYYAISYIYEVDAGTSLEANIEQVVSSVKIAK